MKIQNRYLVAGYSAALCLGLVGCGGGSSTPSDTDTNTPESTSESTYTLSGTVPGTLIEAFCKDGGYYSVNSTDNGTESHPFSITLPSDVNCKLIMTTNEKDADPANHIITPILVSNGTETSSYFQLSGDIDMGHIPLPMTGAGVQTAITVSMNNELMAINSFTYDALDTDGDNIPNVYEDDDNDSIVNKYDEDDDNDGIVDSQDPDYANDSDGDGVDNEYDTTDNDEEETDETTSSDGTTTPVSSTVTLPSTYTANAGRLLGSQCAQCHGTNGVSTNSWESIAGESELAHEIYEDGEPIMSAQADGYTSAEITLIGNWLKTLPKNED